MNELNWQAHQEGVDDAVAQVEEAVHLRELTPEEFRAVAGGPVIANEP